jgi:hypothetical protein
MYFNSAIRPRELLQHCGDSGGRIEGGIVKRGVIKGMSFEAYQMIDAANFSGLTRFAQSPLHYWTEYLAPNREPRKETDAMYRGKAIHAALPSLSGFGLSTGQSQSRRTTPTT